MRKILLLILVMAMPVIAFASADWREKLSVEDVMKVITASHPQCASHPAELRRLSEKVLGISPAQNSDAAVSDADTAPVVGQKRLSNKDLIALLLALGLTEADLDYIQNVVIPLYNYTTENREVPANTTMDMQVDTVAKAPFDGCHFGIGNIINTYDPFYVDTCACREFGGKPKVNGAYPWGMVAVGNNIIWGTVNNILCMPSWQPLTSLGGNEPYENSCWVCEYEKGVRKGVGKNGDMLTPRVYMYNTRTGYVRDITPSTSKAYVLEDCLGLRSAGAHNGVVFLGGPGLDSDQGQTSTRSAFLAFDYNGAFLGQSEMSDVDGYKVTDVRRWLVYNDVLYCGVAIYDHDSGKTRGAILRWYGDMSEPFKFHIVGFTANEAGEICAHNGRLYAGGWPTNNLRQPAIFEGPVVPEGGLTPEMATEWEIKWKMSQYETNPANLTMEQCSMLRSYKGKLYWSIWYVQYAILATLSGTNIKLSSPQGLAYILATMRQATLWRTGDFSDVELVYGEEELPGYDWQKGEVILPRPNASGYKPLYGRAGMGRYFTSYIWAAEEYNGHLYFGTMSPEACIEPAVESTLNEEAKETLATFAALVGSSDATKGYEFYRMVDNDTPAETITENGFGNTAQYGVRNIVLADNGSNMYLGTASPFNLNEYGGWRILKFHDEDYVDTGITDATTVPASVLVKNENGYVTISSFRNEKIEKLTVADLSGRVVYTETPNRGDAYLFASELGTGVFVVTVTTASGSWTGKVSL